MGQRSEKIIHLSKEIFEDNGARRSASILRQEKETATRPQEESLRSLCLAAVAKATGRTAIFPAPTHQESHPLTRYQKVEIDALIFYAAQVEELTETRVREEIKSFLAIASLEELTATNYRRIRDYLWQRLKG
ncbi:MAG TPA: hypothetical protein DCY07_02770 [Rhodospirillaceae bacterium]|nr:hypothetical protein [Rhodospirillaceae bacterium]